MPAPARLWLDPAVTTYRVVLCDHPDCTAAATRRVAVQLLAPPTTGPLLIDASVTDAAPETVDACDAHAGGLELDAEGPWVGWLTEPAEPLEIPAEAGRSWTLIDGGRGRRAQ